MPNTLSLIILIQRLYIGGVFAKHGYEKILAGQEKWLWLGNQMANLGIHWWPMFWGIMCVIAEFGGGIALILGLGTRLACLLLAINMIVALMYHHTAGDTWRAMSYPFSLLIFILAILFVGAGKYSLDYLIVNYFSK